MADGLNALFFLHEIVYGPRDEAGYKKEVNMKSENISVVLVEPQGPINIGSICRVMMNFGFSDLRLVNPVGSHNGREARKMALKSDILIDNAGIYDTLQDALTDCHYAMGTTRRYGKYREGILFPDQAAEIACSFSEDTRIAFRRYTFHTTQTGAERWRRFQKL
jgi:hypothetical protein